MKPIFARRTRRKRNTSKDTPFFKKENSEQSFFGENNAPLFFQPSTQIVQRKCTDCEEDDKKKGDEKKKETKPDAKVKMELPAKPKDEKKKEEDKKLMKKEAAGTANSSVPPSAVMPAGSGVQLPKQALHFYNNNLGYDFGQVKIHTGDNAAQKAKSVHAKAYTIGNNIVFNNGEYSTSTYEGKKLLAHELVHVIQQNADDKNIINRKPITDTKEKENNSNIVYGQNSTQKSTTIHYGCQDVHVEGLTSANYSNSFSLSSSGDHSTGCEGCEDENCVSNTGTVVSVFNAAPTVSLPTVPAGLNECETAAVQNFIDNTLAPHEQQHVAAFNTYKGTVSTPFSYKGCADGEEAHAQSIHEGLEGPRKIASDALSAALDPFNPPIPCDCPEPESAPEPAPDPESAVQAIG